MTPDDWAAYAAAAEALNEGNVRLYRWLRSCAPDLDWSGHDQRAAMAEGKRYWECGPDPALEQYLSREPLRLAIRPKDIRQCPNCGQNMVWSLTRDQGPVYLDVVDGWAVISFHLDTCPWMKEQMAKNRVALHAG